MTPPLVHVPAPTLLPDAQVLPPTFNTPASILSSDRELHHHATPIDTAAPKNKEITNAPVMRRWDRAGTFMPSPIYLFADAGAPAVAKI